MEDTKVAVVCPACGGRSNIPVLEKLIKFKCTRCAMEHKAFMGSIVPDEAVEGTEQVDDLSGASAEPAVRKEVGSPVRGDLKRRLTIWQASAVLLCIAVIILSAVLSTYISSRKEQGRMTEQILLAIKDTSNRNYDYIKTLMTDESRKIFEAFIENQMYYNDPTVFHKINRFLATIEPLDYSDSRKFMYVNDWDTGYFRIDYIKTDKGYKANFRLDDFLK